MYSENEVYLDIGARVLSNLLDLGPALPDNAAHDALVDEEPQLPRPAVILAALLIHEGYRHLESAHNILH